MREWSSTLVSRTYSDIQVGVRQILVCKCPTGNFRAMVDGFSRIPDPSTADRSSRRRRYDTVHSMIIPAVSLLPALGASATLTREQCTYSDPIHAYSTHPDTSHRIGTRLRHLGTKKPSSKSERCAVGKDSKVVIRVCFSYWGIWYLVAQTPLPSPEVLSRPCQRPPKNSSNSPPC